MNIHDIATAHASATARPFLKYAGSKRRMLPSLLPLLPRGDRLVEPFVGGGSVFLASDFPSFLLADANPDLIELYAVVRNDLSSLIQRLRTLFVDSNRSVDAYIALRSTFNETHDSLEKASLFIYLNRFGFNGLCRYNRSGRFNVPYGRPTQVPSLPIAQLVASSERLQRAELKCSDFATVMKSAREGDIVYCDPPYVDQDHAKSFAGYVRDGFDVGRHEELVDVARFLTSKGIPVVVSNHDSVLARELYRHATVHTVQVQRTISARTASRVKAAELIAVF
ncbi:DNA adenine methylase [Paraburkholderia graminis]|uniref:DNA adenine methylase n=1 Tax=Paraburkholderia graminis TaxID=60548 RepID=UPI00278F3D70|nr:DNA adenine methylase [Paraburkholderia graminis]MDQ0627142.1 DNA adenine methylase [Paraburkholderia graminis]